MERKIRLEKLLSDLSLKEKKAFVSALIHSHHNIFTDALLMYFRRYDENFQEIISIAANIISQRNKKAPLQPKHRNLYKKRDLNRLPSQLIGYTASFLTCEEYLRFEISNKHIYYSCNSPNTLQILPLSLMKKYVKATNLERYVSIKHIAVNIGYFVIWNRRDNKFVFKSRNIETLILSNKDTTDWDLKQFLANDCFNYEKIKTVALSSFRKKQAIRNMDNVSLNKSQLNDGLKLSNLLLKMSQLEYLYLHDVSIPKCNNKLSKHMFPKLKGLCIYHQTKEPLNTTFTKQIINTVCHQIEYLQLIYTEKTNLSYLNLSDLQFPKLKELMSYSSLSATSLILKGSNYLKRIVVGEYLWQEMKQLIDKLLINENIQFIKLGIKACELKSTLKHLELKFDTKQYLNKDTLQINVKVRSFKEKYYESTKSAMIKIANTLNASSLKLFRIHLSFKGSSMSSINCKQWFKSIDIMDNIAFRGYKINSNHKNKSITIFNIGHIASDGMKMSYIHL